MLVTSVATPKSPPVDDSHLDPMERAIRARKREAEERKKRTLAAYDIIAKSGGGGPKVVILEEFKDLDGKLNNHHLNAELILMNIKWNIINYWC